MLSWKPLGFTTHAFGTFSLKVVCVHFLEPNLLEIRAISSEWRCYSDVYGTVRRSFTATKFVADPWHQSLPCGS